MNSYEITQEVCKTIAETSKIMAGADLFEAIRKTISLCVNEPEEGYSPEVDPQWIS